MVTVLRAQGLRVVIFTNDHPPAHVHVFGDGQAKIDLLGPDGAPDLVCAEGMTRSEVRRAPAARHCRAAISARTLEGNPWLS